MLGFRFKENFNYPYTALSIKEFWQRWHISLSSWFKEYIYIPLGGNKKGMRKTCRNIFIIFLLTGIWHGANFTFIVWGLLHGVYQVVGNLTKAPRAALRARIGISENNKFLHALQTAVTSLLVGFAWLFFRANSMPDAITLLSIFFDGAAWSIPLSLEKHLGLTAVSLLTVLVSLALLWILDHLLVYGEGRDGSAALTKNGAFVYIVWCILLVYMLLLATDKVSTFIYFQF
jgi:D-alanyl-lipoteichoic acid acyltransferase DltB (MBOAT superfamily)